MKTKYFFLAAMAVIGFNACSNDNSLEPGNDNSGEGIVFAGTNTAVKNDVEHRAHRPITIVPTIALHSIGNPTTKYS